MARPTLWLRYAAAAMVLVCLVAGPEIVRQWIPFAFPLGALIH